MKMRRNLLLLLGATLLLPAQGMMGEVVNENDALQKAMQFRHTLSTKKKAPATGRMYLAYKAPAKAGNAYYVFNAEEGKGYTIVAGNDAMPEILGYSTRGYFEFDEIPENMKVWLRGYELQADYAIEHSLPTFTRKANDIRNDVNPMLKTQWDQGAPYNNLCPTSQGNKCYTGCVATAMAQVMKYYEWPERATGTCSFNGSDVTLSTEYQWDRMLNTYTPGNYTTVQAEAVAQLMYDCGRAVDMNYSPSGSGAQAQNIQKALCNNFGYDQGALYLERKYYTNEEWDNMMYAEIAAGRPVIYSGVDENGGGHEFILDGYRSGGYYHLNWGWSGGSDGYFLLDALAPSNQGAGGGTGYEGFIYEQDANFMIQKPCGGQQQVTVFGPGDFSVIQGDGNEDSFTIANSKLFGTDASGNTVRINRWLNFTGREFTANLGIKLTNVATGEEFYIYNPSEVTFRPWSTGVSAVPISFEGIPRGRYTVYPYSHDARNPENVQRMRCPANMNNYYVLDITATRRTYYEPQNAPDNKTTSITITPSSATISEHQGIELQADIAPVYASQDITWSSSDKTVATVADGIVQGMKPGKTTITATTTDGSGLKAICEITVTAASDVFEISDTFNESHTVTVFDLLGNLLLKDADSEALRNLDNGIYIVNGRKIYLIK